VTFDISIERCREETVVIAVAGEVDLHSAPDLKAALLDAIDQGAREVIVDMSQATFIDSTALGVLVGGLKRLRSVEGELALVCAERSIIRIFEITGLNRAFSLYANREDALAHVPLPTAS
jgi:anti-sigma B factor antagonist